MADAPHCPISRSQAPSGSLTGLPTLLQSIPIATDLPSLIRTVNIMREILRSITTSLTVNNTYLSRGPKPPKIPPKTNYLMSAYPDWVQVSHETESGLVYRKSKGEPDPTQKVAVTRTKEVTFRNVQRDTDKETVWKYTKALDSSGGGGPAFVEDFFERVVNVKWTEGLAVDIPAGAGGKGPNNEEANT